MNSLSIELFERNFRLAKGKAGGKLKAAPLRMLYSKALEVATIRLGIGFKTSAKLPWGDKMTIMYPDGPSLAISRYGFCEEGLTRMLLAYVKPGMVFFDIGAHIGYYTLLASRIVGGEGQVHSFEPTPDTYEVLQANVKDKGNIHINNLAVFSKEGSVTFNDYGLRWAGHNSLYRARLDENTLRTLHPKTYQVVTTTLDQYVYSRDIRPDFIKIDAESAEIEILKGAEQVLAECRPMISIEVGDMDIEGVPTSRELVSYLEGKGYRVLEFSQGAISPHQIKEHYEYDNLLFLPE